ncbi:OmpA/MotB family protein [Vagococcus penaei]|uniref:OmpA/MotB family protein n=1 Tax=Vagococcus penaei TaxID=633807 RepID=UPI0013732730|nr:OmpA family protein [Vagococcus penaei]
MPNQTKEFKSNWELSAARAISVMDSLVANKGVTENRVSIQAYGEFRPKVPNNSAENRAKNRRVEIFIVKKDK